MSVRPASHNIYIEIDRDFNKTFTFQDSGGTVINIEGWSAQAEIRPSFNSSELLATFSTTISGSAGEVELSLSKATTSGLALTSTIELGSTTTARSAVWDLAMVDLNGNTYNYIKGTATIEGTSTIV